MFCSLSETELVIQRLNRNMFRKSTKNNVEDMKSLFPLAAILLPLASACSRAEKFHFFANFRNGHLTVDWLYLYEFNLKKIGKFCRASAEAL